MIPTSQRNVIARSTAGDPVQGERQPDADHGGRPQDLTDQLLVRLQVQEVVDQPDAETGTPTPRGPSGSATSRARTGGSAVLTDDEDRHPPQQRRRPRVPAVGLGARHHAAPARQWHGPRASGPRRRRKHSAIGTTSEGVNVMVGEQKGPGRDRETNPPNRSRVLSDGWWPSGGQERSCRGSVRDHRPGNRR